MVKDEPIGRYDRKGKLVDSHLLSGIRWVYLENPNTVLFRCVLFRFDLWSAGREEGVYAPQEDGDVCGVAFRTRIRVKYRIASTKQKVTSVPRTAGQMSQSY